MGNLAQLDLRTRGGEARIRALLEDLIQYYKGVYPGYQLALAVWFGKSPESAEHNLLSLFTGPPTNRIAVSTRQSLLWKTGSSEPPFVNIYATSVDYFAERLNSNPSELAGYFHHPEVLYFDKYWLRPEILQAFNVATEPSGLIKGWYVDADEFTRSPSIPGLLGLHAHSRSQIGLVKVEESPDFENCRGLLHVEVSQRWLPVSPGGVSSYSFYRDSQDGRPGYFLFEAGSLYRILQFEVKTAPEYSSRVLEKLRDDRYVEVYLRAVRPSEQSAA